MAARQRNPRASSSAVTAGGNSVLEFTKAIQGITKSQENFEKSVTGLTGLINNTFAEL